MTRHDELVAHLSAIWPHDLSAATPDDLPLTTDDLMTVLCEWAPCDFGDALAEINTDDLAARACRRDEMYALAGVGALVVDALHAYAARLMRRHVAAYRDAQQELRELAAARRETREGYYGVASTFGGAR